MGKSKNKGIRLFRENSLLRVNNTRLRNPSTKGGRVVVSRTRASAVIHMLGAISSEEWVAGGGRVVMDETNEDNKGCPNGIDISVNGNGTNKVNFFTNGDGGTGVFSQLFDDFTTLANDGTGLVVGDQDLEGDVVVSLFQLESGVTDLADVGEDEVHGLFNGLEITLREGGGGG